MEGDAAHIRVDFYVVEAEGTEALAVTACRIAEKAFLQAQRVYIHTDSEGLARQIDQRLWTFHDRSFVPHALAGEATDMPVVIGFGQPPAEPPDLLINLSATVPAFYASCARIADLVEGDPARRNEGRQRFRFYRERGIAPETHRV
jgi:DNA polymerase-3 subunit chi